MNVLICGGRDYSDWSTFRNEMFKIAEREFPRLQPDWYGNYLYAVKIIAGGAKGADSLAADWAAVEHTDYKEYRADWEKHGKAAGIIRNQQMLDEGKPDLVIAFPGGNGTADMVNRAKKAGVRVIEVGK
jgi:hypothetical protein